ncbi:MAG: hypothetical protein AB1564_11000 [Chloroflexota bacterium]
MFLRIQRCIALAIYLFILVMSTGSDSPLIGDEIDRARAFTRPIEFEYTSWTAQAVWIKLQQGALGLPFYMDRVEQKQAVVEYLRLTRAILIAEARLSLLYSDPAVEDKPSASAHLRAELEALYARQSKLAPLAESVLQEQVSAILAEQGLTLGGQPMPPVLYRVTPLPMALIISPRGRIEQTANITVLPDLSVEQQERLEAQVAAELDVSTLIVPIGGLGVYPTMILRTADLRWTTGVIAHEWTHNYLTLRPLGMNYGATPELRTMNETTASIVENEIGPLVLARFYPELMTASFPDPGLAALPNGRPRPDDAPFDFRAEMHTTRVRVDELLAAGKIEEAEAYMEQRRQFFWDNGYAIRKLNQAYFAFYGAYADVPGGPAGEDPVGPAVRALREQSASLAEFVNTIAGMSSFDELLQAISQTR